MNRYGFLATILLAGIIFLAFLNSYYEDKENINNPAAVATAFAPDDCPVETDLKSHLDNQIRSRIEGITAGNTTKVLYSNLDPLGTPPTIVNNPDVWTARGEEPLDLSGFSPYNDYSSVGTAGALISPRHVLGANHHSFREGQVLYFVAPDNTVATRTVVTGGYRHNSSVHDIAIVMLDEDLPAKFAYYPIGLKRGSENVSAQEFRNYFDIDTSNSFLGFMLDAERKALVNRTFVTLENFDIFTHDEPLNNPEKSFHEDVIGGDSGKPAFMVIDNQPILLFTHYYTVWGPSALYYLDWVNEVMSELDNLYRDEGDIKYLASTYDLGCFNRAPVFNQEHTLQVREDTADGTILYQATSTDPDGDPLTFEIYERVAQELFEIDSTTGELKLKVDAKLDFEKNESHQFKIKVSDNATVPLSRYQTVTVEVQDVNDGPQQDRYTWKDYLPLQGMSWTGITMSEDGSTIVANANFGQDLYVSRDGGTTFSTTTAGQRNWVTVATTPSGKNILASATGNNLYLSEDFGVNWENITTTGMNSVKGILLSDDGEKAVAIYGLGSGGINYSSDSGRTWTTSNATTSGWTSIAGSKNLDKIYAIKSLNKIHYSSDFGVTWAPLDNSAETTWRFVSTSHNGEIIVALPSNNFPQISEDYGNSWREIGRDMGARDWRGLALSGDGNTIVLNSYNNYVFVSRDRGATWQSEVSMGKKTWSGSIFRLNPLAISKDGSRIAVYNTGGTPEQLYLSIGTIEDTQTVSQSSKSSKSSSGKSGGGGGSSKKKKNSPTTVIGTPLATKNSSTISNPYQNSSVTYSKNLSIGSTGPDVTNLQNLLISKGFLTIPTGVAKGYYGTLTATAHARYEASLYDPTPGYNPPSTPPTNTTLSINSGSLSIGSTGPAVVSLQDKLIKAGFLVMPPGVAKGTYGPLTQEANIRYENSLKAPSSIPTTPSTNDYKPAIAKPATESTSSLMLGSSGTAVSELQDLLTKKGYLTMSSNTPKGYYGKLTETAVSKFQSSNGLQATGIADNETLNRLKNN